MVKEYEDNVNHLKVTEPKTGGKWTELYRTSWTFRTNDGTKQSLQNFRRETSHKQPLERSVCVCVF
jgi:hypothetical protein